MGVLEACYSMLWTNVLIQPMIILFSLSAKMQLQGILMEQVAIGKLPNPIVYRYTKKYSGNIDNTNTEDGM